MPTHPVSTTLLPVNQIHRNPDQPRKDFDPAALTDLKNSIQERGLINPISVMQRGEEDFVIIAGERRFRAVLELGWFKIDARIWPSETSTAEMELLSLVENLQRQDLNPIELANGYKVLTQAPFKMTQEEIARQVGRPRSIIAEMLTLLEQPVEIQQIVARATISPSHVRFLCRIDDMRERIKWATRAGDEGWSSRETEQRVNQLLSKGNAKDKNASKKQPVQFTFSRKGTGPDVAMTGHFSGTGSLDDFFLQFKTAYLGWTAKKTEPKKVEAAAQK